MQTIHDLSEAPAANLAKLFDLVAGRSSHEFLAWREKDYASILNHLFASPLLIVIDDGETTRPSGPVHNCHTTIETLGDALFADPPDIEVLDLIKRFAKREHHAGSSCLPRPVSLTLYYLAIGIAHSRTSRRITDLSESDIAGGITWALGQDWLDTHVRDALASARARLSVR